MEVTILMPCLNEEETLKKCISKAKRSIDVNNLTAEILIADNGSTDNSISIAQIEGARVINVRNKGYGNVLKEGISNALGKYIIIGDSDDSYDFSEISAFLINLRRGDDLVMGNRFGGGIEKGAMPLLHKYLGNPVLSFLGRIFYNIPIRDFHCGLRAVNRESILQLELVTTGMEFASEMIVKSALYNLKISEVPIKLYKDGRSRPPHLNTWSDGWRHLRFLLLHCPKWIFLFPGILLMSMGVIVTGILSSGAFRIGHVRFNLGTMMYSSATIIIGFQIISFYYFSCLIAAKIDFPNYKRSINKAFPVSLEKGLLIGLGIVIFGVILTAHRLAVWNKSFFGNLNLEENLRIIIPAIICLLLGLQIIFNSLFCSILSIKIKNKISTE